MMQHTNREYPVERAFSEGKPKQVALNKMDVFAKSDKLLRELYRMGTQVDANDRAAQALHHVNEPPIPTSNL